MTKGVGGGIFDDIRPLFVVTAELLTVIKLQPNSLPCNYSMSHLKFHYQTQLVTFAKIYHVYYFVDAPIPLIKGQTLMN